MPSFVTVADVNIMHVWLFYMLCKLAMFEQRLYDYICRQSMDTMQAWKQHRTITVTAMHETMG